MDLPDINWNTTKLTFLMLPFDVCTDKGYAYLKTGRSRASPELVKLKGCIDNSTHQTYYWMWYACEYDATPMLECDGLQVTKLWWPSFWWVNLWSAI